MPATPKRPGTVLGAAILLLIFGTFSLLGGVCGGASILLVETLSNLLPKPPAGPQGQQQDPMAALKQLIKEAPGYVPVTVGSSALTSLIGLLAIIAGIGILKMNPTARSLGIMVAVCFILLALVMSGYNFAFVVPISVQVADDQAKNQPPGMPDMSGINKALVYVGSVVGFIFQVVIWGLIILLLRSQGARDAFAGKTIDEEEKKDDRHLTAYSGYDDDDPPAPSPRKPSSDTGFTDRQD